MFTEWIKKRSLLSILAFVFYCYFLDSLITYSFYKVKPEIFLKSEQNVFTIRAYYYGEWWQEILCWLILISDLLFILILCRRYQFLQKFTLLSIGFLELGVIANNIFYIFFGGSLLLPLWLLWFGVFFAGLLLELKEEILTKKAFQKNY